MRWIGRWEHMSNRVVSATVLTVAVLTAVLSIPVPVSAEEPVGHLPTTDDFVIQQYEDFLSRPPDDAGLSYWSELVADGVEPSAVVESLARSAEFEARISPIVRLYSAFFNRPPDFEGLNYWADVVRGGSRLEQVAEEFARSAEFRAAYGSLSDADYVDLVYANVLGRSPDLRGRAYWIGQLGGANPLRRGELMVAFSDSTEFRRISEPRVLATMLYVGMLRRAPDNAGLDYWAEIIASGVPYSNVIAGFLGAAEYGTRMATIYADVDPLTGVATRRAADRPALAVKIDNVNGARPQYNIDRADLLYEEMVEGRLTRLIAVFHSDVPTVLGPVRSVRTTDMDILAQLGTPLLAASGANPGVLAVVADADLVNVNAIEAGRAYYRTSARRAPHNLMARTADLYEAAGARGGRPAALFQYRRPRVGLAGGSATNGVEIDFGSTEVSYAWSTTGKGWARRQGSTAHVSASGTRISPANVVVLEVAYGVSAIDSESPEAVTVGSGRTWVYSDAQVVEGTWHRTSASQPITLHDGNGNPIALTRGQTIVELAPTGSITPK